ncbi:MAG: 7-carboxy-7-deazaguanine synthase QueE [Alphaproteobacteria bacterium]
MFGKNKITKPQNHSGDFLNVQEIFATIQGEGPYAGQPAVFIRLGGCNLQCSFCDTEFDSAQQLTLKNIVEETLLLAVNNNQEIVRKLVVITGGEPMLQPIEKLSGELIKRKFLVQIETNGTIYRKLPKAVKIICSPKNSQKNISKNLSKNFTVKYYPIRQDLLPRINAFKFLISANDPRYSEVSEVGQSQYQIPVFVQPIDEYDQEKNQQNLQKTLAIANQFGYHISLQLHKILKIR